MTLRRRILAGSMVVVSLLFAAVVLLLASGQNAVVVTHGVSMNPVYYQGDLVVVSRSAVYEVGDIVAYRLASTSEIALHRIIGSDAHGFTIKGDNNVSIDVDHPTNDAIVGEAVLHVPQGGTWLRTLTSPPVLAAAAFLLLGGGTTALTRRARRRARRKQKAMSRHLETSSRPRAVPAGAAGAAAAEGRRRSARKAAPAMLKAPYRAWTATAAGLAALGAGLGIWAWGGPTELPAADLKAGQQARVDFSYSSDVRPSAAYDGTKVVDPAPVFRRVVDTVDVHYAYRGPSGTVSVAAELSTQEGWRTTVPLAPSAPVEGGAHEGTVRLDLAALEKKAKAAAEVTGLPLNTVKVAVVPTIAAGGSEFAPKLAFTLSPLQLTLDSADALTASQGQAVPAAAAGARTLALGVWSLDAAAGRYLSVLGLAGGLLALAAIAVQARRRPEDENAQIHRRWASLLVPVQPIPSAAGRMTVDVEAFATLARLAERYGLLVLHWSRSGVDTYLVQDENVSYRYRRGAAAPHSEGSALPLDRDRLEGVGDESPDLLGLV
ncbi:signal peptidase I [Sinomonas halotolerans]|uniref:Signal peptidase I n=1 Tax=Sinomonas halotolerans TaxID=1644133 RepID=A0ABU9X2J0_9MICC